MNPHKGGFCHGYHTETAATLILELIQPKAGSIIRVNTLIYEAAATAHTLTFMKALGASTVTVAAAAAATSLTVAAKTFDPASTAVAASDYAAVQLDSGRYQICAISAVSGLVLTVGALDESVSVGAPIYYFGAAADTGHFAINAKASTVNELTCAAPGGIVDGSYNFVSSAVRYKNAGYGRPVLMSSNNATNAGFLRMLAGTYNAY